MNIIYFSFDCQMLVIYFFFSFSFLYYAIYPHSQVTMYKFLLHTPHMQVGIGASSICQVLSQINTEYTQIDKFL